MKEFDIKTTVVEVMDGELTDQLQQLVSLARKATYRSYAPYSLFSVGAAILLSNGEIITGSNQENAAYPSSLCAERTAAYYAHSAHPDAKFSAIAIAARDTSGRFTPDPIAPCGACRQALLEYERLAGGPVRVLLAAHDRVFMVNSVQDLLPLAFMKFD